MINYQWTNKKNNVFHFWWPFQKYKIKVRGQNMHFFHASPYFNNLTKFFTLHIVILSHNFVYFSFFQIDKVLWIYFFLRYEFPFVCNYLCIYVLFASMFVCIYVYMYVYILCMYVYMYESMSACMYACICINVCVDACM